MEVGRTFYSLSNDKGVMHVELVIIRDRGICLYYYSSISFERLRQLNRELRLEGLRAVGRVEAAWRDFDSPFSVCSPNVDRATYRAISPNRPVRVATWSVDSNDAVRFEFQTTLPLPQWVYVQEAYKQPIATQLFSLHSQEWIRLFSIVMIMFQLLLMHASVLITQRWFQGYFDLRFQYRWKTRGFVLRPLTPAARKEDGTWNIYNIL